MRTRLPNPAIAATAANRGPVPRAGGWTAGRIFLWTCTANRYLIRSLNRCIGNTFGLASPISRQPTASQATGRIAVSNFLRVIPYVWPHRQKVYISILFAGLVAVFWGVNLSVAYPVVKVLLQEQSPGDYVEREIADAQREADNKLRKLAILDARLKSLKEPADRSAADARIEILEDRARQQRKLSAATRKLMVMTWLKANVLPWLPADRFDLLVCILLLLLLATALKGLCIFVQEVLVGSVVELTTMGVRKDCFRKALDLDYQTVSTVGTATLMSRFTYDMTVLGTGLKLLGGKVIREPLKAAACLLGAFLVSWQLTLLSLVFAPLAGLIFYRIGRKLKQASHRLMESMSRIYKTLEESFEAFKVVTAFNGAGRQRKRFHRENRAYYSKAMKIVKIDALTSPTTELLGMLAALVALLPGAYLVLRDTNSIWGIQLVSRTTMDVAELTLMYVLLAGIIDPARKLSTTYAKVKRAAAAADRIFEFLDREALVKQAADPKPLPRHEKSIEFRNVSFSYRNTGDHAASESSGPGRRSVLQDVSLTVAAGEAIVIVGANGSGKSTLAGLLPRFFDPDQGAVMIDGMDTREVRLRELRAQIGIVTQETLLFDQTVFENIAYGKPGASTEQVENAARRAYATEFIERLPDGFQTMVGEKGRRLSGGQRQRIALARAILRDPAILILDEATSSIDADSERLIHQALREFVKGRTTFLITHSVSQSILDFVSRIVVMSGGRIVAAGTHESLMETCSFYQRLHNVHVQKRSA